MKELIENALNRSISYDQYKNLVIDLLTKDRSTGNIQNLDYLNYSKLGMARIKRIDKTYKLSDRAKIQLEKLDQEQIWLVISEGWCGDAAHVLPIMNKMAQHTAKIDLKIVLRDENDTLMDQFLTNGSRSIPKLIVLDKKENKVIATWGPRPSEASKMVQDQKANFGILDKDFKKELQVWYNKNKGQNIEQDLLDLVSDKVDSL